MQNREVPKGTSSSGTRGKYVQNTMRAPGLKRSILSGGGGRHQDSRGLLHSTPVSTNSSRKPLIPKAVKGTVQIKCSIPLISSQWENSWDISVKVRMQSSGPNLFAEEQWSTPACTVEKVGTILPSASHPGRELRKMTERWGFKGASLLRGQHGGRTWSQFVD